MLFFKSSRTLLINLLVLVVVILFALSVASIYVDREHTFYWWDYLGYQRRTLEKAVEMKESFVKALFTTWQSTGEDYNGIPTLLLAPFTLFFGDFRLVYILSITLVYLLPFTLVVGAIAVKLIPFYPLWLYWSTIFVTLLMPVVWVPTLRGYVDIGGALLMALALWVYLYDLQLKYRWQLIAIAFFIAAAILFRRHFIYEGFTFFFAMILQAIATFILERRNHPQEARQTLYLMGIKISAIAGISFLTLIIFGWHFFKRIISVNFAELYSSYEVSASECIWYYGVAYGWLAWLLTGIGFSAGFLTQSVNKKPTAFIILFASLSLIIWILKVKILGVHYTTNFSIFVILGLVIFGWTSWIALPEKKRIIVLTASSFYLIINGMIGLTFMDWLNHTPLQVVSLEKPKTEENIAKISELFSANYPPLTRADYSEVVRLIDYLRSLKSQKLPIYVASSSNILNNSILRSAEQTLYPKNLQLSLLVPPQINSRDVHPLGELLKAGYVVVANPVQYHLRPEAQEVVKVVVDSFNNSTEIARDFQRLPEQFRLENDVLVTIYQRVRPTSVKKALLTLKNMNNSIEHPPSRPLKWMNFSEVPGHAIAYYRNISKFQNVYYLKTINQRVQSTKFIYLDALPKQTQVTGKIQGLNQNCTNVLLKIETFDPQGNTIDTVELSHRFTEKPNLALSIPTEKATYLLFDITVEKQKNATINSCSVRINNLELSGK